MTNVPLTTDQWNYIKDIKDSIRNNALNVSYVTVRNITRGSTVSGFIADIWDDNYSAPTILDSVVSGEFFDTVGKNYQYSDGGRFKEADAQFLTHYTNRDKFIDCEEVWKNVLYNNLVPQYVSGTNDFISGECYQIIGIKDLPYVFETNIYMKLRK